MAAAVLAALRRKSMRVVQVQNPRMDISRFDLIVANRHDELTGPNVFVTRTALHRVNASARLDRRSGPPGGIAWRRMAGRLVAVLLGGSNGRYRLDLGNRAAQLAADQLRDDG